VEIGAVSVGQAGIIGGGGGGEEVNQVHAKQNETFFGAVNFFVRFFFRFFFIFFLTRFSRRKFAQFFLKIFLDGRAPGQARLGKIPHLHPPLYIKPYIKPYILFTKPAHNCYMALWYNNYIFLKNCFSNFEAGASRGVCLLGSEGRSAIRTASNYLRGPSVVHLFFHDATLAEKRRRASFFSHFFSHFFLASVRAWGILPA